MIAPVIGLYLAGAFAPVCGRSKGVKMKNNKIVIDCGDRWVVRSVSSRLLKDSAGADKVISMVSFNRCAYIVPPSSDKKFFSISDLIKVVTGEQLQFTI